MQIAELRNILKRIADREGVGGDKRVATNLTRLSAILESADGETVAKLAARVKRQRKNQQNKAASKR